MTQQRSLITLAIAAITFSAGVGVRSADAAEVILPQVPLIVSIDAIPNVWFQLDDSGSIDTGVNVGEHFSSCAYNPVLQCSDTETPLEGGMRIWGGRWNNGNGRPVLTNITDVLHSSASVKGEDCYENGTYNVISECIDDYGTQGRRSQNNRTRNFDIDRDWRIYSSDFNVLFFNPNFEYKPWSTFSGPFPQARFDAARYWPVNNETGYGGSSVRNLGTNAAYNRAGRSTGPFFYHVWIDDKGFTGNAPTANPINMTANKNGVVDQWDSYIKVTVTNGGVRCDKVTHDPQPFSWPGSRQGINPTVSPAACESEWLGGQTESQLRRSIANWYQYYQKRVHVQRSAVGNVVVELPNIRYGTGTISGNSDGRRLIPAGEIADYNLNGQQLLQTLYSANRRNLGTPLRNGLEWVGDMYAGDISGVASPINLSCQKNFSLLFTDGYWNGGNPGSRFNDVDGDNKSIRGSRQTLADVAAYFYRTDLRPDLEDAVPTDSFDSAAYQHMVTYTVAFGVTGALSEDPGDLEGWPFPTPADNGPWYPANDSELDRIDDMWHAAWNGRGKFFSARRPEDLFNDVREALSDISARIGGAASAAANSGSISSSSRIFQAKFDSSDWHGDLLAFPVNDDGTLGSTATWDAGELLNAKTNAELRARNVFTWNDDGTTPTGTAFSWSSISSDQAALLNRDFNGVPDGGDPLGQLRLEYVLGDRTYEGPTGLGFRSRANVLGDIVNSDPIFVGFPPFFYSFDNYQAYFASNVNRTGVIYVGANDGMLHAFNEATGEEMFAYVPDAVIEKLPQLTNPDYGHTFFVDGPPGYGDVRIAGPDGTLEWKSVIVGALRAGGQAVYALDVTRPDAFDRNDVLWEFNDEHDFNVSGSADLGYVWGEPQIKRMANGRWAVIIGNGLNNTENDGFASTTGQGYLYVIFLEEGINGWTTGDYVKIPVPGGDTTTPNGLFTPAAADIDGDAKVDFIYAGDLRGRMWKFDVTSNSPSNWGLDLGGQPLFDGGTDEAITDRPAIAAHPEGRSLGQLVLFGTGKFIETSDNETAGQSTQAMYALWDFDKDYVTAKGTTAVGKISNYVKSDLQQNVYTDRTVSGQEIRVIENGTKADWLDSNNNPSSKGWYLELPDQGERMIRRPVLRDNLVFFVTMTPDPDPCAAGGTGFISVLDISTGIAPTFPVFDVSGDLDVTTAGDTVESSGGDPDDDSDNLVPVGIKSPSIPNLPALIYDDRPGFVGSNVQFPPKPNTLRGCESGSARAYTFTTGSNGSILAIETATEALSCGRQSWRGER